MISFKPNWTSLVNLNWAIFKAHTVSYILWNAKRFYLEIIGKYLCKFEYADVLINHFTANLGNRHLRYVIVFAEMNSLPVGDELHPDTNAG